MVSCAVYNCTNAFGKGGAITFHRFPLSNPKKLKTWLAALRMEDFMPTRYHYLCSKHFSDDCFLKGYVHRRKLKDNAVPSIVDHKHEACVEEATPTEVSAVEFEATAMSETVPQYYEAPSSPPTYYQRPDEVMESLSQLAAKYDHTYSVASRKVNRLKDAMCEAEEEVMAEPGRWQNWGEKPSGSRSFKTDNNVLPVTDDILREEICVEPESELLIKEPGDVSGWNWDNSGDAFEFLNVKQDPDDQQHFCTWMGYGEQQTDPVQSD